MAKRTKKEEPSASTDASAAAGVVKVKVNVKAKTRRTPTNHDATKVVLARLDYVLAERRQAVKKAYAAQTAWTDANCAVLRARLEGVQPEPGLLRDYYKTLAEWSIAHNRDEGSRETLENVFMTASLVLGERELPEQE